MRENHVSDDIVRAHEHRFDNAEEIGRSTTCGCFHCLAIFPPTVIEEWVEMGEVTALCPECDVDSIIGSASWYPITKSFLAAMRKRWFNIGE